MQILDRLRRAYHRCANPEPTELSFATLHNDEIWVCPPPALWRRLQPFGAYTCACNVCFRSMEDFLRVADVLGLQVRFSPRLRQQIRTFQLSPGAAVILQRLERTQAA